MKFSHNPSFQTLPNRDFEGPKSRIWGQNWLIFDPFFDPFLGDFNAEL